MLGLNQKSTRFELWKSTVSSFCWTGVDRNLVKKILDPHFLSRASVTFTDLQQTINTDGPWASAWIGESGGAYNSGGLDVSDTFVDSFW